jgi:hypothetical protein
METLHDIMAGGGKTDPLVYAAAAEPVGDVVGDSAASDAELIVRP